MVTAEDIARIPVFASLDGAEREPLARAAADISLVRVVVAGSVIFEHPADVRAGMAHLRARVARAA